MLGSYNGKVEAVKNGDWMKIGVEAPEETNSRRASKIAGVNGPSMSKPARPQHIYVHWLRTPSLGDKRQ